ncbi:Reverse transcriptase domain - like 10 [Theobroma cacao]|nr:Reverse transcriptase domain - like 10 [Theobroma cacao]
MNVRDGFSGSWILTVVYGHPNHKTRRTLWVELSSFAEHVTSLWLLSEDFNAFLYAHDKVGGSSQGNKPCLYFQRFINAYGLIDLGFKGSKYIWTRKLVFESIDWVLCNTDWRLKFHEATVQHLSRIKFDHRPLLISLGVRGVIERSLRFQFQATWLSHSKFNDFVKQNWEFSSDIQGALKMFSDSACVWNKEVFGNIFSRKKRILARLGGIERELEYRQSRYLQELEAKLRKEYELILQQEEVFWLQKSKANWLTLGDRNTKYFHLRAVKRRTKAKILHLLNMDGLWLEGQEEVRLHVVDFFRKLYSKETETLPAYPIKGKFLTLNKTNYDRLTAPVGDKEVHKALFAMKPMKTPGINGIHALFFQNQWDVVGSSLVKYVQTVFSGGKIGNELGKSLIVLIPKSASPEYISQYRPISLLLVIFKVLMKIITNRLKPYMSTLVAKTQSSFIPERAIIDNVIVTQEVMHSFRKKKGKVGWMMLKIDLEKAYNRLR